MESSLARFEGGVLVPSALWQVLLEVLLAVLLVPSALRQRWRTAPVSCIIRRYIFLLLLRPIILILILIISIITVCLVHVRETREQLTGELYV